MHRCCPHWRDLPGRPTPHSLSYSLFPTPYSLIHAFPLDDLMEKWAYSAHYSDRAFCLAGRELVIMDLVLVRLLFLLLLVGVCAVLHPFGLNEWQGAAAGFLASGAVVIFELRVRALSREHPTLEDVFVRLVEGKDR